MPSLEAMRESARCIVIMGVGWVIISEANLGYERKEFTECITGLELFRLQFHLVTRNGCRDWLLLCWATYSIRIIYYPTIVIAIFVIVLIFIQGIAQGATWCSFLPFRM